MSEDRKLNSFRKIIGLSTVTNGYVSCHLNENSVNISNLSKWHMMHKPYQNDYPRYLINR